MNPGKWIVVVFILFAAFIGTLVTICVREDISLVAPDYYKQELAYQEQIDRIARTQALTIKPVIQVHSYSMRISFDSTNTIQQGTIKIFCPSNQKLDRTFNLKPGSQKFYQDLSNLLPGMYRVKLQWSMDDKDYYQEEIINL